jgi:hypothetical protein
MTTAGFGHRGCRGQNRVAVRRCRPGPRLGRAPPRGRRAAQRSRVAPPSPDRSAWKRVRRRGQACGSLAGPDPGRPDRSHDPRREQDACPASPEDALRPRRGRLHRTGMQSRVDEAEAIRDRARTTDEASKRMTAVTGRHSFAAHDANTLRRLEQRHLPHLRHQHEALVGDADLWDHRERDQVEAHIGDRAAGLRPRRLEPAHVVRDDADALV